MTDVTRAPDLRISRCSMDLAPDTMAALRERLSACPDLAFTYLAEVQVDGHDDPAPTLFVWLEARALGSVRSALDLVARAVAQTLPAECFLDVVILNSAPDLLDAVAAEGDLVTETNPDERRRAMAASTAADGVMPDEPGRDSGASWWRRLLGG
jgi:hypothetical protein